MASPPPRGIPQIEVTFDIDANGILNVSAKDKGTGKEQKITIQNATNLTDEEVEKMKAEAEKHADEDAQKKALVDKRNEAETLIITTQKTLKEAGDKIDKETEKSINQALESLKEVKDKQDATVESIDSELKKATEVIQKYGESLYKAASQAQSQSADSKTESNSKNSDDSPKKESAEEGEVVE